MAKITSSELVYRELKSEIMFLKLEPGQQISETEIAEKYSVSRTPVREAFRRLKAEGLIVIKPQSGTIVSLIDIDEISDILYIREKLELSILQEIKNLNESQRIKLRLLLIKEHEILESHLESRELSAKFLELDNELHEAFFTFANKSSIWKRISQDQPHYNRIRVLTNRYEKADLKKLYNEHIDIVVALNENNVEKLNELYQKHIYGGMESLAEIINQNQAYFR